MQIPPPEPLELSCKMNGQIFLKWTQVFKIPDKEDSYVINMKIAKEKEIIESGIIEIVSTGKNPPDNQWSLFPLHNGVQYEFDVVAKKGDTKSQPSNTEKINFLSETTY
jgi:hypothetical protein